MRQYIVWLFFFEQVKEKLLLFVSVTSITIVDVMLSPFNHIYYLQVVLVSDVTVSGKQMKLNRTPGHTVAGPLLSRDN